MTSPSSVPHADAIVAISHGRLHGISASPETYGYLGIPYAAPPIGDLRWRPPGRALGWTMIREATGFGPDPVQPAGLRTSRAPRQSEDCLYLNVWAPKQARHGGWPVLVWLCGGGFTTGGGAFAEENPVQLAARGSVVVSVNVRLNVFGFFAHPGLSAESRDGTSGNYGLMDLAAALRWVRENIAGFGGDPGTVTFFGESAGAAMGLLLLAAPAVSRPYDRAILQSPGSFDALLPRDEAERHGLGFGDSLSDLRALTAEEAVARASRLPPVSSIVWKARPLRPIVDGWLIRSDDPTSSADFRPVPAIIGTNEDEGRFFEARMGVRTEDDLRRFAGEIFGDRAGEAVDRYREADGGGVPGLFSALYGDRGFNLPIERLTRRVAALRSDVYRYVYGYRSGASDRPPTHGEEIGVLMDLLPHPTSCDAAMTDLMAGLWLRFAQSGRPGSEGVHWPRYDEAGDRHLWIDLVPTVRAGWRSSAIAYVADSMIG